ncbi:MAG TPA: hypothetical protein VFS39_17130 [Nitrospira sp.]|nr:hypothetical protein [Nitrospira sp.]
MRELDSVLNQALTYCRTLVAELNPSVLKEQGLTAGIRSLSIEMKRYGLEVSIEADQVDDLAISESGAALVFRSVRELLINTAKHTDIRQASIHMTCANGLCGLSYVIRAGLISEHPAEAHPDDSAMSSWFGLHTIRERVKTLNGHFDFESAPKEGTTATIIVPMLR